MHKLPSDADMLSALSVLKTRSHGFMAGSGLELGIFRSDIRSFKFRFHCQGLEKRIPVAIHGFCNYFPEKRIYNIHIFTLSKYIFFVRK